MGKTISVQRSYGKRERNTHLQSCAFHTSTIELIPDDVPDSLRDDLVCDVSVRVRGLCYRVHGRQRHESSRAVHAQCLHLRWTVPLVTCGARHSGGVAVEVGILVAVHAEYVHEFVRDRQQSTFVRLDRSVGGVLRYVCVDIIRIISRG